MSKLFAMIPAAVLAIGAVTVGAVANRASSEKNGVSVDYSAVFSKNNEQKTERTIKSDVSTKVAGGNYVDENGNGICDNYADGSCPANGTGGGYHYGNGNYVDNDGDGVCDNYAGGSCPANGTGSGSYSGNGNGNGTGRGGHHGNGHHGC